MVFPKGGFSPKNPHYSLASLFMFILVLSILIFSYGYSLWFDKLYVSTTINTADPFASISCYKIWCCSCCCCHHQDIDGYYWDQRRGLTIYINQEQCHHGAVLALLVENNIRQTGVELPVLLESIDIRIEGPMKVERTIYIGPFNNWSLWDNLGCCSFGKHVRKPPFILDPGDKVIVIYVLEFTGKGVASIDVHVNSGFVK